MKNYIEALVKECGLSPFEAVSVAGYKNPHHTQKNFNEAGDWIASRKLIRCNIQAREYYLTHCPKRAVLMIEGPLPALAAIQAEVEMRPDVFKTDLE